MFRDVSDYSPKEAIRMLGKVSVLVAVLIMIATPLFASLGQSDLDQVVAKLSQVAGRSFSVEIDYSQDLNAWARSDGQLGVTQGMLNALQTHDQLAFVVGHEMTHVIRGHHHEQMKAQVKGGIAGALLGYLIGKDRDDVRLGAELGAALNGARVSRDNEYEADDRGAMELAYKAGYSVIGGIEVLQLLQTRFGNGDAGVPIVGWLATHPDTGNRIGALRKLAATLVPTQPAQLSNIDLINQILSRDGWVLSLRAKSRGAVSLPDRPMSLEGGGR